MSQIGRYNAITDVEGLKLGHFTNLEAVSGSTVVLCEEGAVAGVDVRGSAPGTRETDLLAPMNLVEKVQAVVLSGGSVYGLSVADGVVRWLAEQGLGFPLEKGHVAPIVPAAVLFDLGRGPDYVPLVNSDWGRKACEQASEGQVETGTVGVGTGALAGSIKGGFGTASLVLDSGITVAAAVGVNSLGSVINPSTGRFWEIGLEKDGEFGTQGRRSVKLPVPEASGPARNTTIGIVATDGVLTKAQAQKVAQMAHDGMGRAIRPAHTLFDGDTIFCMVTGKKPLPEAEGFFVAPHAPAINEIGHAAADCMSRAIIRGALTASSLGGLVAFRDLEDGKEMM